VIDQDGYRLNVGIILVGPENHVFLAKRYGQFSWQFPQGGIKERETPEIAVYRELQEEIGLSSDDVRLCATSNQWLSYRLPKHLIRRHRKPICIGQKQKWFLFKLVSPENKIRLDLNRIPEFDSWRWVEYWQPMEEVIFFKRNVYQLALKEFAPLLFSAII
jgi:putative (di)nucleoside polyphosphate hydrolase